MKFSEIQAECLKQIEAEDLAQINGGDRPIRKRGYIKTRTRRWGCGNNKGELKTLKNVK